MKIKFGIFASVILLTGCGTTHLTHSSFNETGKEFNAPLVGASAEYSFDIELPKTCKKAKGFLNDDALTVHFSKFEIRNLTKEDKKFRLINFGLKGPGVTAFEPNRNLLTFKGDSWHFRKEIRLPEKTTLSLKLKINEQTFERNVALRKAESFTVNGIQYKSGKLFGSNLRLKGDGWKADVFYPFALFGDVVFSKPKSYFSSFRIESQDDKPVSVIVEEFKFEGETVLGQGKSSVLGPAGTHSDSFETEKSFFIPPGTQNVQLDIAFEWDGQPMRQSYALKRNIIRDTVSWPGECALMGHVDN